LDGKSMIVMKHVISSSSECGGNTAPCCAAVPFVTSPLLQFLHELSAIGQGTQTLYIMKGPHVSPL